MTEPSQESEQEASLGVMARREIAHAIVSAQRERDEAFEQRDAVIEAVRDCLGERDPEWFPDGFPSHLSAIEAIRWMAARLANGRSCVPSRWDGDPAQAGF